MGRPIRELTRLGKRIVWRFEGDLFFVFHLMIAGRFQWKEPGAKMTGRLGLAARPLTSQEAGQLGVAGGLVVEQATGPSARAGLQPGDVILALNNQPVRTVDDFRKLLAAAGNRFALLIQRGDARLFVPVRIG